MPTFADIAEALGVSKGTVSKAMSNAEDISPETRKIIIEKAVEMGYKRHRRAKGQPHLVVFVCNMDYETPAGFAYDLIMGFRKGAEPEGYPVDVIPLTQELQTSISYDGYMLQNNCAGGLFLGLDLCDPWLKEFETCSTPTVLYDNHVTNNPRVTQVGIDNVDGMKIAIAYFQSLGHSRIGYLGIGLDSYVYRQRYNAYFNALELCGTPADSDLVGMDISVTDCLYHHLPRLLEKGCTAIVCSHDILASAALTYCRELGKSVPEDVSILGFDDLPLCEYTFPPLSSIRQDRSQIGRSAWSALHNQIHSIPVSCILMHPQLICRSSCAPLKQS